MAKFQPEGWHTVTPWIVAPDPQSMNNFIQAVFDARGEFEEGVPSVMKIGDSVLMVSDGGACVRLTRPFSMLDF